MLKYLNYPVIKIISGDYTFKLTFQLFLQSVDLVFQLLFPLSHSVLQLVHLPTEFHREIKLNILIKENSNLFFDFILRIGQSFFHSN